jgi:hypothetical protein
MVVLVDDDRSRRCPSLAAAVKVACGARRFLAADRSAAAAAIDDRLARRDLSLAS